MNRSRGASGHRSNRLAPYLITLASCGVAERTFIELPDRNAMTIVLAHRADDDAAFQIVVSAAGLPFVAEIESRSEAYLLHYELSSTELGLAAGTTPRCAALLPRFKERLEGGRFEEWVGPLPESVQRALVADPARCSPCRPVRLRAASYSDFGTLKAGAWLGSGPLVSHLPGGFRRVDETNSTLIEGCGLSSTLANVVSIARVSETRYWIGNEVGELGLIRFDDQARSCTIETSTVVEATSPDQPRPAIVALSLDPFETNPDDLYALVDDGRLLRYAAGGRETIGVVPVHPLDLEKGGAFLGQILPIREGRALAIAGWNKIAWWGPDGVERIDEIELPLNQFVQDGGQRVASLAIDRNTTPPRLLAGCASGLLFSFDPSLSSWVRLQEAPALKELRGLEYFDGRWLLIIEQGDLAVWHPETGMCPELFRMPLATNSGRCIHRARRGSQLAIFDAIGDNTRPSGVVWIEDP